MYKTRYLCVFRRNLLILALLIVAFLEGKAQYDPSFSHYWAMETAYNPAAVGKQEKINITAAYSMALAGFKRNPKTMYASGDMPFFLLGAYHGVGIRFINDAIGLFSHKNLALQYAYKQKLFGGTLNIGVQAGMLSENFDGSKVDLNESGDPAFSTSEVTGTAVDLSAGLYYQHRWWYAGASVQHLTAPTIEMGETNQLEVAMAYYLTAGCNIRLRNPFLTIQPSVLGRSDGVGYRADITTRLTYSHEQRRMYVGVGYSPENSVTVYLGGNFHGITLGYSYEAFTNGISLGNGSHELYVGYQMDMNLFKKGRNRHQSVRIL
ncbi:MAG: PorP/SprF family type IX secretion system membrane protein [Prevotella sp.]|nr:PorP/SprF family type IX secretion system membrane protein [Prevotella sp.]